MVFYGYRGVFGPGERIGTPDAFSVLYLTLSYWCSVKMCSMSCCLCVNAQASVDTPRSSRFERGRQQRVAGALPVGGDFSVTNGFGDGLASLASFPARALLSKR